MKKENKTPIQEELVFWNKNLNNISLMKRMPEKTPNNEVVIAIIKKVINQNDYSLIPRRIEELKKML